VLWTTLDAVEVIIHVIKTNSQHDTGQNHTLGTSAARGIHVRNYKTEDNDLNHSHIGNFKSIGFPLGTFILDWFGWNEHLVSLGVIPRGFTVTVWHLLYKQKKIINAFDRWLYTYHSPL